MSASIPSCEPTQFVAGDSVAWTRALVSYPATDGWLLHYRIVGPYELASDPVVTVVGGVFNVALAAAATAAEDFIAGTYRLMGWVDGVNSERHAIIDTLIEILPNVAVASFASLQTHTERMIAACEAALEGRLSADVSRYGREGNFVEKLPIEQIRSLLGSYYARRHRETSGSPFLVHQVSFGAPSRSDRAMWPEDL